MREILFRGKREDTDEWIYGDLLTSTDIVNCTEIAENTGMGDRYDVIPETVGQYTGLTDRTGKKIFEGDILKLKDYHHERIVYVFWGYIGSWFYGGDGYSDEYIFNSSGKEVIGNIYDNPELLGGDEQREQSLTLTNFTGL